MTIIIQQLPDLRGILHVGAYHGEEAPHSGMARVFSYEEQGPDHQPQLGEHAHDPLYFMIDGSLQNHMSMGIITLINSRNDWFAMWDAGFHDDPAIMGGMHHEDDDVEYEIDLGWKRYFNPNFSTVLGWRFTNLEDAEDRAFAGIKYRLPYLIESSLQFDSAGDLRVGLGKSLQITDRIGIFGDIEYDTGREWEWTVGADYLLTKQFSLITQYYFEHGFGGGFRFRF